MISEFGKSLIYSFKHNPEDWEFDHYYATHTPTSMRFWIANGAWFFDGNGKLDGTIGIFERHIIYRQLCKCRNKKAVLLLGKKNDK